jgi:hypothetical protein
MGNDTLRLKDVGPIQEADVTFGDLTVLVGPQATGKSVLLQFLRLLLDTGPIFRTLRKHGLKWDRKVDSFLDLYLGEGMGGLWHPGQSSISWRDTTVDLNRLVHFGKSAQKERSFFIPAQRVLALSRDGWFRPFTDYKAGDPFTVRDFSEKLRVLMESSLGRAEAVFPQPKRLKGEIRKLLSRNIFRDFHLEVDKTGPQKRLLLTEPEQATQLPFMVWSAGQREFVPLLLGLYWLLPPTKVKRRGSIQWVIIEELEAGLHPKAIEALLFIVLDLLWREYRVCLSTHSAHVLDLVWALRNLREHHADPKEVLRVFDVKSTPSTVKLGDAALTKEMKVHYFDQSGTTHDISNLDPAAEGTMEAHWGGLTEFSGRVADIVAEAVAASGGRE